jgi:hypothetical protein
MSVQGRIRAIRRVLAVTLAYALVVQALLAQATELRAASPETSFVICRGNGDAAPAHPPAGDESLQRLCHFCVVPAADGALVPDAVPCPAVSLALAASAYFSSAAMISVTRPPSRAGLTRAPPSFA